MTEFDVHADLPLIERLQGMVALWRTRKGASARRFGTEALGDPCFVGSLTRGRSLRLRTADRVLAFMGYPPLGPLEIDWRIRTDTMKGDVRWRNRRTAGTRRSGRR